MNFSRKLTVQMFQCCAGLQGAQIMILSQKITVQMFQRFVGLQGAQIMNLSSKITANVPLFCGPTRGLNRESTLSIGWSDITFPFLKGTSNLLFDSSGGLGGGVLSSI